MSFYLVLVLERILLYYAIDFVNEELVNLLLQHEYCDTITIDCQHLTAYQITKANNYGAIKKRKNYYQWIIFIMCTICITSYRYL
jgi:hypothetical protein